MRALSASDEDWRSLSFGLSSGDAPKNPLALPASSLPTCEASQNAGCEVSVGIRSLSSTLTGAKDNMETLVGAFDDSGKLDKQSNVIVFAGCVAYEHDWASVATQWEKELAADSDEENHSFRAEDDHRFARRRCRKHCGAGDRHGSRRNRGETGSIISFLLFLRSLLAQTLLEHAIERPSF